MTLQMIKWLEMEVKVPGEQAGNSEATIQKVSINTMSHIGLPHTPLVVMTKKKNAEEFNSTEVMGTN